MLYNVLMPPRATSHGARTRTTILRTAAGLASVDGLDGLSIGRLATELAMSKSGLFAHFGSKEELQLATIEEARKLYAQEVIEPGRAALPQEMRGHGVARKRRPVDQGDPVPGSGQQHGQRRPSAPGADHDGVVHRAPLRRTGDG